VRVREPRPEPMRKGGGSMEAGRMITALMTGFFGGRFGSHKERYQPTLPFPICFTLRIIITASTLGALTHKRKRCVRPLYPQKQHLDLPIRS
jgi:hypothetical protein